MELEKLSILIGTWKTNGTIEKSHFGPAGSLRAVDTYQWSKKKDFILHTAQGKMGRRRFANSEVISHAPKKNAFAMYSFENGTSTGVLYGKRRGQKWHVSGPSMRFRGEFSADGKRLTGAWRYKTPAGKWKLWMSIELRKSSR